MEDAGAHISSLGDLRPPAVQASQGRQEEVESKEKNNTERRFEDVYMRNREYLFDQYHIGLGRV